MWEFRREKKGTWVFRGGREGCVSLEVREKGGEIWGAGGGGASDDRSSLIPLESPPIVGHSLSVSSEAGFELFRIHEGKRQDSRLKQTERNGSEKKV